jgi:uncharacterized membrane protein YcaP (DUF421 family)
MKKEQIHLGDWQRILMGEVPASFYLELIIRALIIYLILMISMRAMGKRMSAQLSRNELAALVSLAAAVGVPMMAPNRGLLPAIVIAIVVVSVQRIIAAQSAKSQSFEKLSQGNISILISESVISVEMLSKVGLSQAELFAQLRGESIIHLGMVDRFYMEANGAFTLIKQTSPKPGLTVLPDSDPEFLNEQQAVPDSYVCDTCGLKRNITAKQQHKCTNCGHDSWVHATI